MGMITDPTLNAIYRVLRPLADDLLQKQVLRYPRQLNPLSFRRTYEAMEMAFAEQMKEALPSEQVALPGEELPEGFYWKYFPVLEGVCYCKGLGRWSMMVAGYLDGELRKFLLLEPAQSNYYWVQLSGGAFTRNRRLRINEGIRPEHNMLVALDNSDPALSIQPKVSNTERDADAEEQGEAKTAAGETADEKAGAEAEAPSEAKTAADETAEEKAGSDAEAEAPSEAKTAADETAEEKADAEAEAPSEAKTEAGETADEKAGAEAPGEAKIEAGETADEKADAEAEVKEEAEAKEKTAAEAKEKTSADLPTNQPSIFPPQGIQDIMTLSVTSGSPLLDLIDVCSGRTDIFVSKNLGDLLPFAVLLVRETRGLCCSITGGAVSVKNTTETETADTSLVAANSNLIAYFKGSVQEL